MFHHLFAVEPDVEVATDAVDVRFRFPIGAGVFGVGMAESDMDAGDFFVLKNIADDAIAGGVGADGEFADAIAIFVGAGVGAEVFE